MVDPEEMVSVPKALLAKVLDTAESDSYSTENEFASTDAHNAHYTADRELIAKLRVAAGLAENHAASVDHGHLV